MTLTAKLAAFMSARPGQWIDGRELAFIGGAYAWRSRLSDLRRAPFFFSIENRQRRIQRRDGRRYIVSEYRYRPEEQTNEIVDLINEWKKPILEDLT